MHRVRRGDTLGVLARRYKTTIQALMGANKLKTSHIQVGTVLVIPANARAPRRALAARDIRTYTVRRGDTLQKIARRYRTTVQALLRANDRHNSRIQAGEALVIPGH
jgi:LysM repeat protein